MKKALVGTVLGATFLLAACGGSEDAVQYQERIDELESMVIQLEEENQQMAMQLDDLMIEQDYEMEDESERLEEADDVNVEDADLQLAEDEDAE